MRSATIRYWSKREADKRRQRANEDVPRAGKMRCHVCRWVCSCPDTCDFCGMRPCSQHGGAVCGFCLNGRHP